MVPPGVPPLRPPDFNEAGRVNTTYPKGTPLRGTMAQRQFMHSQCRGFVRLLGEIGVGQINVRKLWGKITPSKIVGAMAEPDRGRPIKTWGSKTGSRRASPATTH